MHYVWVNQWHCLLLAINAVEAAKCVDIHKEKERKLRPWRIMPGLWRRSWEGSRVMWQMKISIKDLNVLRKGYWTRTRKLYLVNSSHRGPLILIRDQFLPQFSAIRTQTHTNMMFASHLQGISFPKEQSIAILSATPILNPQSRRETEMKTRDSMR